MSSSRTASSSTFSARWGVAVAIVLDAALITVFAALGRSEHDRAATLAGLWETAWPFLAGAAIAWLAVLAWRSPLAPLRSGVPVWIGAVGLGMLFRALSGQGTAFAFILVATGTLLAMLVGWRCIFAIVRAIRRAARGK